jgi:predicted alpha/beta superfamily hydrolase
MRSVAILSIALLFACAHPVEAPTARPDAGAEPIASIDATTDAATDAVFEPPAADAAISDAAFLDADNSADAMTATASATITIIRVHYPAGAHTIALRGSLAPFSWNQGVSMRAEPDDVWTISTASIAQPIEWKPLLDDSTWSRGPNYTVSPGATVDVYPHFTQTKGQYARAYDFTSTILGNTRGIWIYQPPTYLENTRAPMPVLYMHDGQNLFDPSSAFGGNEWMVDETMDAAAEDGSIAEAIVIGIENTSARIDEYTPVADPQYGGGAGASYLRMIVEELKPRIDREIRTLPDRAHTSMMGSSLGGLISAYAGVTRADVFGRIGAMSPSTWWDARWLIGDVAMTPSAPRPILVYVDSGDSGPSNDDVTDTSDLAAQYRTIGYADGSTLDYVVQAGGQHNEIYWAQRLPAALHFLLGPGR